MATSEARSKMASNCPSVSSAVNSKKSASIRVNFLPFITVSLSHCNSRSGCSFANVSKESRTPSTPTTSATLSRVARYFMSTDLPQSDTKTREGSFGQASPVSPGIQRSPWLAKDSWTLSLCHPILLSFQRSLQEVRRSLMPLVGTVMLCNIHQRKGFMCCCAGRSLL